MKTKIRILIALVLLSAASVMLLFGAPNPQPTGYAQTEPEVSVPSIVSTSTDNGGMRTLADTIVPSARYGSHIDLNQPSVSLERLDIRSFTLRPNQVGVNRSVQVSPNTRAQKFVNPDGSQTIVLIIKSSGASGIGVHFRNFALADGEEVYVYGTGADSIVFGPFTDKGPWADGEFWSGTVDGDTVVVEFYKRTNENGKGFEIFEVSHIFAELDWRLRSDQPDVLNCEHDASCNPAAVNTAVARIIYDENGEASVCTGTLLNDLPQDRCPYFLTANHCVSTQAVARTVEVFWFYQTTWCGSNTLRPWIRSPPGADLIRTQAANDFSLLLLRNDPPREAAFAGWNRAPQPTGTFVFGLHHPGGYIPPQIHSYLRRSVGRITNTNVNEDCVGGVHLVNGYEIGWLSGTTEYGSSGSGLFTSNGRKLVGVQSCATVTCDSPLSLYSKFANFYSQIQPYIGSLTPLLPRPPRANPATLVTSNSFRANWRNVCAATGYRLDVATDNSFTNYVTVGTTTYHDLQVGDVTSRTVIGLNANTTYYYRVRARNGQNASGDSNVVQVITLPDNPYPYDGFYTGLLYGAVICPGTPAPPQPISFDVSGGIVHDFSNFAGTGTVDASGHMDFAAQCAFHLIGSITQNHHASGTWGQADGCNGCMGPGQSGTWFADAPQPVAITNPATNVTRFSATLNGTVNPHGNPHGQYTAVRFEYGTTTSYGNSTFAGYYGGNTTQSVSANISGLSASTTYHFRIVAQNMNGTSYGADRTFITPLN